VILPGKTSAPIRRMPELARFLSLDSLLPNRPRAILAVMADSGNSITDWITALGTAGGFLAAGFGFLYDRYRRRKTERYAQARLVDGWLVDPEFGKMVVSGDEWPTMTFVGYVSNASSAAVRDVRFRIQPSPHAEDPLFPFFNADVATVVPPTRDGPPFQWTFEEMGTTDHHDIDYQKKSLRGYILWVRFTDTAGQRWVRHPDGRLEPTRDVTHERAAEWEEMERQSPGITKAMRNSLTPEHALDILRELNSQHDKTQNSES
jgi:hypothetical protein